VTFLIALLICKGAWVSRLEVCHLLWGDAPEEVGRKRLRQLLYRAKGFDFSAGLRAEPERLRFDAPSDLANFMLAVNEKRWSDAARCYGGELLSAASFENQPDLEEFFALEREHLAALYQSAVLALIPSTGPNEAFALLERALGFDPLSETLLQACWQSSLEIDGRRRVFDIHKSALRRLELKPTQELELQFGTFESPKSAKDAPRVADVSADFIGRHSEIQLIEKRLADPTCRLVTLIGVGGAGKTRLGMAIAVNAQTDLATGVCFVPLAGISVLELVPAAVLEALGVSTESEPSDLQLLDVLAERELLLVLDNLEHLPGIDLLVDRLLEGCSKLRILTTSRQALGLSYEHLIDVAGFPVPDSLFALESQDAARLFLRSARRVQADFHFGSDLKSFIRIFHAVSGMPLGLELAAGWVRALSLPEIADELERSLDLLSVENHDLPERHRSFAAAFASSWILLNPIERNALARLSVFRGSFNREWALKVSGSSLNVILKLINKSMVSKRDSRFFLHELIRQYAFLQLTPQMHSEAMFNLSELGLDLSRQWYPQRNSVRHGEMSRRVELEMDNLRPSLEWSLEHQPRIGAETIGLLEHFWNTRGYHREGFEWGRRFESRVETKTQDMVRAHLLWMIASLGKEQSKYDEARAAIVEYQEIGEAMGSLQLRANSQKFLGLIERERGNLEEARVHFETAIGLHTEHGNTNQIAMCHNDLGQVLLYQNNLSDAKRCFQIGLELKRSLNDPLGVAYSLGHLANVAGLSGNVELESSLLEESLRVKREVNDVHGIASGLQSLGNLALRKQQFVLARAQFAQALTMFVRLGRKWSAAHVIVDIGLLEFAQSQPDRAYLLLLAGEKTLHTIGAKLNDKIQHAVQEIRNTDTLNISKRAKLEIQAHAMTYDELIEMALESQGSVFDPPVEV
jgi:tetratricopeptide (TPR) repeat protein